MLSSTFSQLLRTRMTTFMLTRCVEISRHEYKWGMVYRGCWWNVCFVLVWYWIIMTQIFHVLVMACYLVGHSYKVRIVYICYWQTISCLMVICGLLITNSSLGVMWDACIIWIWSVNKFTNAYSTRMWNMRSSPATPTMCLEQKSENF